MTLNKIERIKPLIKPFIRFKFSTSWPKHRHHYGLAEMDDGGALLCSRLFSTSSRKKKGEQFFLLLSNIYLTISTGF